MNPTTNIPTWTGVAASGLLVVIAVGLAGWGRMGLSRDIVIACVRAGVQLMAVGALLLVLFRTAGLAGAVGWVTIMVVIAGQVAGRRGRAVPRARLIATAAVAIGAAVTLGALLAFAVVPTRPEVVVPVGGMIVSGAMQASALTLLRLGEQARDSVRTIEARLLLGFPGERALAPHRHVAARTALLPAVDATKVVGLISLPGAMTGLILAGVDPLTAIRYQIVVMYMLLAAAVLATVTTSRLAERALFDRAHRLRVPAAGSDIVVDVLHIRAQPDRWIRLGQWIRSDRRSGRG